MDNECADAQVALGAALFLSEWDWIGAERSLQRALEINPHHTEALLHYGSLLEALGQLDQGLQLKQQALERDPASPLVLVQIATSYWNQRRYDDALAFANKALNLDPRIVRSGTFKNNADEIEAWQACFVTSHTSVQSADGGPSCRWRSHDRGTRGEWIRSVVPRTDSATGWTGRKRLR
jgi:tetratricopeptide (TPR) repeat protein